MFDICRTFKPSSARQRTSSTTARRDRRGRHAGAAEGAGRPAAHADPGPRAREGDDRHGARRAGRPATGHRRPSRRPARRRRVCSRWCAPARCARSRNASTVARARTIMFPDRAHDGDLPFVADARRRRRHRLARRHTRRLHDALGPHPRRARRGVRRRACSTLALEFSALAAGRRRASTRSCSVCSPPTVPSPRREAPMAVSASASAPTTASSTWATALSNIGDGMSAIAYPWLATAITRNPLLIALVAAAQRLPVVGLHVARRRHHRPRGPQACHGGDGLPAVRVHAHDRVRGALPAELAAGARRREGRRGHTHRAVSPPARSRRCCSACAEVLRDNCGQTFMPSIVAPEHLERANGRMWSIESVANTFIGPPLGSLLLLVGFSLPFFVDAGSFFVAAALGGGHPRHVPCGPPRRRRGAAAVEGGAERGCPLAVAPPAAALDGDHPRR